MKTIAFFDGRRIVVCPETAVRALIIKQSQAIVIVHVGDDTYNMMLNEAKLLDTDPKTLTTSQRRSSLTSAIFDPNPCNLIMVTSMVSGDGGGDGGTAPVVTSKPLPIPSPAPSIS